MYNVKSLKQINLWYFHYQYNFRHLIQQGKPTKFNSNVKKGQKFIVRRINVICNSDKNFSLIILSHLSEKRQKLILKKNVHIEIYWVISDSEHNFSFRIPVWFLIKVLNTRKLPKIRPRWQKYVWISEIARRQSTSVNPQLFRSNFILKLSS